MLNKANYSVTTRNRFAELGSDDDSETAATTEDQASLSNKKIDKQTESRKLSDKKKVTRQTVKDPSSDVIKQQITKVLLNKENDDVYHDEVQFMKERNRAKIKLAPVVRKNINGIVRPNQRLYDRRSGTGRGKEIKRHGAGSHNWGNEIIETTQNYSAKHEVDDELDHARIIPPRRHMKKHTKESQPGEGAKDHVQKNERYGRDVDDYISDLTNENEYYSENEEDNNTAMSHRPKTYNLSENAGRPFQRQRVSRQRRGKRVVQQKNFREEKEAVFPKKPERALMLDLSDASAFPTLA